MPGHEINNGFPENNQTPENQNGVRLSTQAAETLSGIFNMSQNPEICESKQAFCDFVVGSPDNNEPSLHKALVEIIYSSDTTEIPLAHGDTIKVNNSLDGIHIARTLAPKITPWVVGNGTSYVQVPHQSFNSFTVQNGKYYNLGGIFGGFVPEKMHGYLEHALKETRELQAALRVQQLNDEPVDEARVVAGKGLRKLANKSDLKDAIGRENDTESISTLYDEAGYFLGVEYLDWLTQDSTISEFGLLIKYGHNQHLRLSYQRENEFNGRFNVNLGHYEHYPIGRFDDKDVSYEVLRPWLSFGRSNEHFSYAPTIGESAGQGQLIAIRDDPQRVAEFKAELGQALHIVANALDPTYY